MNEFILLLGAGALLAFVGLAVIEGAREVTYVDVIGGAANTTGIRAAVTDTGVQQVITTGLVNPPFPTRISATAGGTAGDIKAIQVVIAGLDPAGVAITESLPAFTVNTAGTKIGTKVFSTITSITIPAHDGTGATTAIGIDGAPAVANAAGILAAVTDDGTEQTITTGFIQPDTPRNVSATSGGTAGDIKAIQVTVNGTNESDEVIQEVLPVFTVNSATTVVGAKAFKTITSVVIPAHDGTGATTAFGFVEVLGLTRLRSRKTIKAAYLAEALEGTAATEVASATAIESNTADLNTALNGTQVKVEYTSADQ